MSPGDLATPFDADQPLLPGLFAALAAISDAQRHAARGNDLDALEELSLEIMQDLERARSRFSSPLGGLAFDFLCFRTATGVASPAFGSADGHRAHAWFIRSLCDDYHGDDGYPFQQHRLMLWQVLPGDLSAEAAELAAFWVGRFFWFSWSYGELVSTANALFDTATHLDEPVADHRVCEETAVEAAIHRTQWAIRYRPEDVDALVQDLEAHLRGTSSRVVAARIHYFFACTDSPLTTTPQDQRALFVLDQFGDIYRPGERLALHISTCWGRLNDLVARFDDIAGAAREESAQRRAVSRRPTSVLYRLGMPFQRIAPAIRVLAEEGRSDLAMRLLGAWHGLDDGDVADDLGIIGLTTSSVNTRWCRASTVRPPLGDGPAAGPDETGDLDETAAAATAFLGKTMADISNREVRVVTPRRPGVPDPAQAARFASAARRHLRLDALSELMSAASTDDGQLLVPLPGMPLPIQPLMIEAVGRALPLSTSLRRPAAERPLRRVAVLGDTTSTSEWERDSVAAMLRGAAAEVRSLGGVSADEFVALYEDPELDAIWLASHAEFDHRSPDNTTLQVSDRASLSLDELANLRVPDVAGRRLLVLNVCDGGHAATHGGLSVMGIAPVLSGPRQSVVSHLWPVAPAAAAAFGILFGTALAAGAGHLEAFNSAVALMLEGRDRIVQALRSCAGEGPRLAQHLSRSSLDLSELTHWGSATLHV